MFSISASRSEDRANRARADFLLIDSEIALTFCGIALASNDREKRRRTERIARNAYDTIMRMKLDIALTDVEVDKLDHNMQRLKSELERLGEKF
jgi:hypothetical protein